MILPESLSRKQAISQLWNDKDSFGLCRVYFDITLTPLQEEIVRSVAFDEHPRTIVCCMTRYGKSYSVAMGVLLWILMHPDKRIVIIAPTNEKTSIIRNYLAKFITQSQFFLELLDIDRTGAERIQREVSKHRMTWKNGVELRTLSAEGRGEALMGFGADKIIVDEECDIDFEVYRSKITRMLGDHPDSTYVGIGNPWHRDNQMYQHWIDPSWHKIHVGWQDALKEGRITQTFLDEQRMTLTDREFKILYDALFPEESEDQLIKYSWIQRATKANVGLLEGSRRLGVDVARTGVDATVLTWGVKKPDGSYAVEGIEEHNQEDTMRTVGNVMRLNSEHSFEKIIVDTSGLGAGVTDRLREAKSQGIIKAEIIAYTGGQSSSAEFKRQTRERKEVRIRFLNTKAEAYFKLRGLFEEDRISIPKNLKLIDQLTKMKWDTTSSDKIRILDPGMAEGDTAEQKSPDFADSLCYFCWESVKSSLAFASIDF